MADLTLREVRKAYGNLHILHGIDLDIKSGEFIVFVGPSGCGKSTLAADRSPGSRRSPPATLQIAGEVVNDVPPSKRGIAMVFQSYALYPHMTVYDNMAFGMKIARESKDEIDRRVRQAADILQLTKYLERLPKALSGGQRQRVAIGRAIVRNPKVFLFDEPLSNLDAALRVATRIEIAKLKESMPNTTMIYVTHDQVEAMTLADRIVVLKDGHIEQVGTPMELYKQPGNLFVAQFIGSPAMNILPAKIEKTGQHDRRQPCRRPQGDRADRNAGVGRRARRSASACGRRICAIATGADYLFEGTVDYVEQLGEVQLVYVDIGRADLPLVTKLPGNAEVKRGDDAEARRRRRATCTSSTRPAAPSRSTRRKPRRPDGSGKPEQHCGDPKVRAAGLCPPLLPQVRLLLSVVAPQIAVAALRGGLLDVTRRVEQFVDGRVAVADRARMRGVDVDGRLLVDVGSADVVVGGIGAAGGDQNGGGSKNDLLHYSTPEFADSRAAGLTRRCPVWDRR